MEKIQKVEIRVHRGLIADLGDDEKRWMAAAIEAAKKAYAPYSRFQVGAVAVLEDGTLVSGRIRRMRLTRRGSVPSGQHCLPPGHNIPTCR